MDHANVILGRVVTPHVETSVQVLHDWKDYWHSDQDAVVQSARFWFLP